MFQVSTTGATFGTKQAEADGDRRYTWRFMHLTFQEFFVAQKMLGIMVHGIAKKSFWSYNTDIVKKVIGDKLYDSWCSTSHKAHPRR